MTRPKRLITLDKRTDRIAERVKRTTHFGFSSWVRQRLIAWDDRQKYGYEESREVERLRLERKAAAYHKLAMTLAKQLTDGSRAWVGYEPSAVLVTTFADQKREETDEEVVE